MQRARRGVNAMGKRGNDRTEGLLRALELTTEAMDLVDAHRGPPEAGSYLALAQQCLRRAVPPDARG